LKYLIDGNKPKGFQRIHPTLSSWK